MTVRPCEGGPFDGRDAAATREPVAFLDDDGRAYSEEGLGRALYRHIGGRWIYLGRNAYRCRGCGSYVEQQPDGQKQRNCPLCGRERT